MTKADLFRTELIVKEEEGPFMIIEFSNIARYTTMSVLKKEIPLTEYLDFLESVFLYEKDGTLPDVDKDLNFSATKTTGMIMYKGVYFKISLKDMYNLVKIEVEKLFIQGIIK